MPSEQGKLYLAAQKICRLVIGKEASILHGIANCVKNGITRKTGSSNRCQGPTAVCHAQLVSIKFENLVHSIFRKEKSYFGVLHCQQWRQWQHPTSAPDYAWSTSTIIKKSFCQNLFFKAATWK